MRRLFLVSAFCSAICLSAATVGVVDFPVTASKPETQACFNRAVAMLHNFWFEEAREYFESCAAAEPGFQMAWWGVAMTYNHSLWNRVWPDDARKALAKITNPEKLSAREQKFVGAVGELFGKGSKREREIAYSAAMAKIAEGYPDDLEAATFYSLSLIAIEKRMKAAAISLDVYGKQPEHPGAAHYIIHAFDDPQHAILALPAADRYAKIAPEAHHALHMPTHIYLQLGMWPETIRSNEQSWAASVAWQKRKNMSLSARDYHSQYWLAYAYLQMGRAEDAWKVWQTKRQDLIDAKGDGEVYRYWADLGALLVISTGAWDRTDEVFTDPVTVRAAGADGHAHVPAAPARAIEGFARGWAAALKGEDIGPWLDKMEQARQMMVQRENTVAAARCEAQQLMVKAIAARKAGKLEDAIALLKKANVLEAMETEVSGPPDIIKPSFELAGEMLLEMNQPAEARKMLERALERHPKRRSSLDGLARTSVRAKNQ